MFHTATISDNHRVTEEKALKELVEIFAINFRRPAVFLLCNATFNRNSQVPAQNYQAIESMHDNMRRIARDNGHIVLVTNKFWNEIAPYQKPDKKEKLEFCPRLNSDKPVEGDVYDKYRNPFLEIVALYHHRAIRLGVLGFAKNETALPTMRPEDTVDIDILRWAAPYWNLNQISDAEQRFEARKRMETAVAT